MARPKRSPMTQRTTVRWAGCILIVTRRLSIPIVVLVMSQQNATLGVELQTTVGNHRVEERSTTTFDLSERELHTLRCSIRPVGRHRLEDVRDRKNARTQ